MLSSSAWVMIKIWVSKKLYAYTKFLFKSQWMNVCLFRFFFSFIAPGPAQCRTIRGGVERADTGTPPTVTEAGFERTTLVLNDLFLTPFSHAVFFSLNWFEPFLYVQTHNEAKLCFFSWIVRGFRNKDPLFVLRSFFHFSLIIPTIFWNWEPFHSAQFVPPNDLISYRWLRDQKRFLAQLFLVRLDFRSIWRSPILRKQKVWSIIKFKASQRNKKSWWNSFLKTD